MFDRVEDGFAHFNQVIQPTRRGNNAVHTAVQGGHLRTLGRATVTAHTAYAPTKLVGFFQNLHRQFTRWGQNQQAGDDLALGILMEFVKDGQQKGARFACRDDM
jgi:hypothetical protein